MHLRLYNEQTDFTYMAKWIRNEREHALWCANLLPYPLSMDGLRNYFNKYNLKFIPRFADKTVQKKVNGNDLPCSGISGSKNEFDTAYVYADAEDHPIGFLIYTVNEQDRSGFLRFIMVDSTLRGKGYGAEMLRELQRFAQHNTGVSSVRLIVFDVNTAARKCYERAGFTAVENTPDAFSYRDEIWGRCMMEHKFIC